MNADCTIAFVHGVYLPDNARIDTMPFVLNSLRRIAAAGWTVDVFLWEKPGSEYAQLFPSNVTFMYLDEPILNPSAAGAFKHGPPYDLVFGVGQMGALVAALITQRNNCPLVLFNDEFPSQWGVTPFMQVEKVASQYASMIVVPCPSRIAPLLQELQLGAEKPCVAIPNGPEKELPGSAINWKDRLGLSADMEICLNAGSIADFAQVPELMTTVPLWPDNTVLVLNERNRHRLEIAQRTFAHLSCDKRIVWNPQSLTEEELHSLVASSALNFSLYRNSGPNIEYAGFSSGKLMRSIAASVPVIASYRSSFQFVEEHNLGRLVDHPMEIPEAIVNILDRREEYAANCRVFYREQCRFEPYWEAFCDRLGNITGFDLRAAAE